MGYTTDEVSGENWTLMLGDSCERLAEIPTNSIDLSICSPPFANLFVYSASPRDLGNSTSRQQFLEHYGYIIREQLRVTKPGRMACIHVQQLTTRKSVDGYMGLTDFRGQVIQAFIDNGWTFYGEVTIWKNPQCLRDGTPVLTPAGWTPIEQLAIGDLVIGSDGLPTKVIDVPYKGTQPVYRVALSDGDSIYCGPQHLWTVRSSSKNNWKTIRTDDLVGCGRFPSGAYQWEIPIVNPVHFDSPVNELPIAPITFGALLADGSWSGQRHVSITKDIDYVTTLPLPPGHTWTLRPGSERANSRSATFGITSKEWHNNDVLNVLRDMGLANCRAWEKFVPRQYMTASVDDRRELLRGLMNGDGRIHATGGMNYRTTSPQLALDITELVRSLGGNASIRNRVGSKYGDDKQGRSLYEVQIKMAGDWCPFSLPRKAERWTPDRRAFHSYIKSVELLDELAPMTCISVSAEDGLYVTDHYVVTHNSQAIRTKAHPLMFVTKNRDSSGSRPALADYLLLFRKPGENRVRIKNDVTNEEWIEWAAPIWEDHHNGGWLTEDGDGISPVWFGIKETDTLNVSVAREYADERHICPLQLPFIDRCIRLWSNKGETVLTPFAGIGSEVYEAIRLERKGIGIELKERYFRTAVSNLKSLERKQGMVRRRKERLAK